MNYLEQNLEEFERANIMEWRNAGYSGKGVTIVVLDDNSSPRKFDNIETPFPIRDAVNHNTNVCGVLRQVSPKARIIAFPWFTGVKKEIVDWILEHKHEIDLINCSFSSTSGLIEELHRLNGVGIPIVCASGNNGSDKSISIPAKFDFTIAVGAFTGKGVVDYSNGGKELDCVGFTNIYILNTEGRPIMFNGTSCASPFVVATLSYYVEWRKEHGLSKLTNEQAREFIRSNCKDLYEEGFDNRSGWGKFVLPKIEDLTFELEELKSQRRVEILEKYKDIQEHWAADEIVELIDKGILNGYPDGTFKPDEKVTRAELAKVISKVLEHLNK